MMTTAPACLFYQIITSQFWTFIYLTLARLVGSERYLICEKQANIGHQRHNLPCITVTRNSCKWPRVVLNAIPQNYQMPHGPLRVRRADGTRHYGCVPWRGVYANPGAFNLRILILNPHSRSVH